MRPTGSATLRLPEPGPKAVADGDACRPTSRPCRPRVRWRDEAQRAAVHGGERLRRRAPTPGTRGRGLDHRQARRVGVGRRRARSRRRRRSRSTPTRSSTAPRPRPSTVRRPASTIPTRSGSPTTRSAAPEPARGRQRRARAVANEPVDDETSPRPGSPPRDGRPAIRSVTRCTRRAVAPAHSMSARPRPSTETVDVGTQPHRDRLPDHVEPGAPERGRHRLARAPQRDPRLRAPATTASGTSSFQQPQHGLADAPPGRSAPSHSWYPSPVRPSTCTLVPDEPEVGDLLLRARVRAARHRDRHVAGQVGRGR